MPVPNKSLADQWSGLSQDQRDQVLKQLSPAETEQLAGQLGWFRHPATVSGGPAPGSIGWLKEKAMTLRDKAIKELPTVGGIAGGLLGAGAGAETGPGAIGTAALGAAAGGGLGEDARQALTEHFHHEDARMTAGQSAKGIAGQAVWQGASEAAGQALGKALRPTLERAVNKLYYAGNLGPHEEIEPVMDEILRTERMPGNNASTVGGFVDVLNKTKGRIGQEVDMSMRQLVPSGGKMVPLASVETVPAQVSNRLMQLTTAHPSEIELNPAKMRMLRQRALLYQKPRSFGWLNDRRIVLNNHLQPFYSIANPADKARFLFEHPELEADKAETDALRDAVYPAMDKAAKKPAGYFENLQRKRGAIMAVDKAVMRNLDELTARTKRAKGAPALEKAGVSAYGTASGKPGFSVHRLTGLVHTPNPLASANKRVASAFGHTAGSKIAKGLSSPAGMDILSLPLRLLATPDAPLDAPDENAPPSLKQLRGEAAKRKPAAPGPQSAAGPYTHVFDEELGP
jgi:hypothetical protein